MQSVSCAECGMLIPLITIFQHYEDAHWSQSFLDMKARIEAQNLKHREQVRNKLMEMMK